VGALAAALLVPAAGGAAPGDELERARERIDRVSAELAAARSAADGLGGAERAEAERLERRLQARKDALIELEARLAADRAQEPVAPEEDDGPVVEAAETADAAGPAQAQAQAQAPVAAPPQAVVRTQQEVTPTTGGGDAGLAARIDGYLASKASPLTGLGAVFVAESRRVGLDPRFLVAIAGSETSFGTYGPSQAIHNPFGMGPHIEYPSWEAAIAAAATNLSGGFYVGEGRFTIGAIQQRWAPAGASNDPTNLNSNWARNVSIYYAELGGDPLAPVFDERVTGGAGAPAAPALPVAAPAAAVVGGDSGAGPEAAEDALGALGTRSVDAGASPERGFDAAGLVRWAYGRHGVTLPRWADAQARLGTPVEPEDLEAGDAVFFSDPSGRVRHVGLYLGDGQIVHAPGAGRRVALASLYDPVLAEAYAGARRY
jgi:cell wall-associated NlpC family hydrolase